MTDVTVEQPVPGRPDLLGRPTTADEDELLELYRRCKALAARDLDPCVRAGVRAALVGLWNVVNDLGLEHEQLVDLGA